MFHNQLIFRSAVACALSTVFLFNHSTFAQQCTAHYTVPMYQGDGLNSGVRRVLMWDDGNGPALYVGGFFTNADGVVANHIAKWNGTSWSSLGTGAANGVNDPVKAMAVYDDGNGPALYVGGDFTIAGGQPAPYLAKWNGSQWSAVGSPNAPIAVLHVHDDGSGPSLFVGGTYSSIGGITAAGIAKWNGTTWAPLAQGTSNIVEAMITFDDGNGPRLYVGGDFLNAGGMTVNRIAAWDGTTWHKLANGLSGAVRAFAVVNFDGTPRLYLGGGFQSGSGTTLNFAALWNGTSFSPLGTGLNQQVQVLRSVEIGGVPYLFAGGNFTNAGGVTVRRFARWDGTAWSSPAPLGVNNNVFDLLFVEHENAAPGIVLGGTFTSHGSGTANRLAEWRPGEKPYILHQPEGGSCDAGGKISLHVGAAPYEPMTYQWRRDGKPIDDTDDGVAGADSSSLVISPASASHTGWYDVVITNICGEAVSVAVEVIIEEGEYAPADLNNDGHVDVLDLLILLAAWGTCPPPEKSPCPADLNHSGSVDVQDLLILLANWG